MEYSKSSFLIVGTIHSHGDKNFHRRLGIHQRISSMSFPHSNCRAELIAKAFKRILTNFVGPHGSLEVDSFPRAVLQYKNAPAWQ